VDLARFVAVMIPRRSGWSWLAAAALLLVFPVRFWSKPVGQAMLSLPASPVGRANPGLDATWRFLRAASPLVPAGATYTVRAAGPEAEMEATMVSLGLLVHARCLPSSYYGRELPEVGGRAAYVLVLPGAGESDPRLELVARLDGGAILRHRQVR
jgi:hypothetical protein